MRSLQYLLALVVLLAGAAAERPARDISPYASGNYAPIAPVRADLNEDGYFYRPGPRTTGYFYEPPKIPFLLPSNTIRNVYTRPLPPPPYLPPPRPTYTPPPPPPTTVGPIPNVIEVKTPQQFSG